MHSPLEQMAKLLGSLSGTNRRLAQWYIDNFAAGSALPLEHNSNDVARAVGVSRATVIRFARELGYSGFPAFRNALFQTVGTISSQEAGSLEGHPLAGVASEYTQAIATSLQMIDSASFNRAADLLASAPIILWVGWGDSFFAAASAEHKCRLGGLPARSANDVADLDLHLGSLPPAAVAVLISQSGRWQPIADAVAPAREHGVRVISFTGQHDCVLAQIADISFVTQNPTFRVAGHPFTLRPAQTALLDAVILEAVRRVGKHSVEEPRQKSKEDD